MTELQFKVLPTEYDEFIQFAQKRQTKQMNPFRRYVYLLYTLFILGYAYWQFKDSDLSLTDVVVTVLTVALTLGLATLFVFLIRRYVRYLQRKQTKKDADLIFSERTLTFSDEQFTYHSARAQTTYQWSILQGLEQTPQLYLLFVASNQALMIPKRVFENLQQQMQFEQMVKSKMTVAEKA
jgi:hypothetical protein